METPAVAALQQSDPMPLQPTPAQALLDSSSFESLLKHSGKAAMLSRPGTSQASPSWVFLEHGRHERPCDGLRKHPANSVTVRIAKAAFPVRRIISMRPAS